jgi:hypothetical protein
MGEIEKNFNGIEWEDNYKEETPKKQVECLPSNATLRI